MANITQILGTDSVSSSRVILNDNFTAINSDLADIANVLNTTTETITLTGAASFGSANIASGKVTINATAFTSTVPVIVNAALTAAAASLKSVKTISTGNLPAANSFVHSIYKIGTVTSVTLNVGDAGQEIVLVADGNDVTVSATNVAGATGITISNNGALSLKFAGSKWYITGSHGCTIV
jgi:hypothetical protein